MQMSLSFLSLSLPRREKEDALFALVPCFSALGKKRRERRGRAQTRRLTLGRIFSLRGRKERQKEEKYRSWETCFFLLFLGGGEGRRESE